MIKRHAYLMVRNGSCPVEFDLELDLNQPLFRSFHRSQKRPRFCLDDNRFSKNPDDMRMAYFGTRLTNRPFSPPRPVPAYLIRITSTDRLDFGDSQDAIASVRVAFWSVSILKAISENP